MVIVKIDNYSTINTKITIPADAHIQEAFEGLYQAWIAAGYLEEQFEDMCKMYGKNGLLMFFKDNVNE